MEKNERETHDFMNVESFSQLPFIRPTPPVKEKGGAIRLFGKEFGVECTANATAAIDESNSIETNASHEGGVVVVKGNNDNGESSRKFECHYCCRNFPTSQALGGHQNAHKRERQHAKRAHLQSTMVHGSFSEAHHHAAGYGFLNYHRLGSASTVPYQTWSAGNNRFYGGGGGGGGGLGGSFSQATAPINGSPLGLWRIPPVHSSSFRHEHSVNPVSLFSSSGDEVLKPGSLTGSSTSQNRFGYESKQASLQDHVSLDLRL